MPDWPGPIEAITLFADDLDATSAFYQDVFGLPVHYSDEHSAVFRFGETLINVLVATEGPDLIHPAPVAAASAGSRVQFTLGVDDVDAMCEQLRSRGVELVNGPMDRAWGIRTACFADPAGHLWEIAAPL